MSDIEQRARKLLNADIQGEDRDTYYAAISVISKLLTPPEGWVEQHQRDSKELRRLCASRDFYKARCEALQAVQSSMRDPERKAVCDILANGATKALPSAPEVSP